MSVIVKRTCRTSRRPSSSTGRRRRAERDTQLEMTENPGHPAESPSDYNEEKPAEAPPMKVKDALRTDLPHTMIRLIMTCYVEDIPPKQAAKNSGVDVQTITRIYGILRQRVLDSFEPGPDGRMIAIDPWADIARNKRKRRGGGKPDDGERQVPAFRIHEDEDGFIYTEYVGDNVSEREGSGRKRKAAAGRAAARGKGRAAAKKTRTQRIWQGDPGTPPEKLTEEHIKFFRFYANLRLAKFPGMSREVLFQQLKETEWRHNNRGQGYHVLLKYLRRRPREE